MSPAPHLLLIDQDPADRSRAAAALAALFPGSRLREVELGADFFDALKESTFDVVVTELETPWASWPFLLGAIRALQPGAAIVVYTRDEDPVSHRSVLGAGASACVVKSERGLLDLTQAVDRSLRPQEAAAAPSERPARDGTTPRPEVDRPASGEEVEDEGRAAIDPAPARTGAERVGGSTRVAAAMGLGAVARRALGSLRDREAGGPLAIFVGVVALTALLTVLLLGSGENPSGNDDGPRGVVASEAIRGARETPPPTVVEPEPARAQAPASSPAAPLRTRTPDRGALASDAPLAIELRPRGEVWVRLYMDGTKVLENTLEPGDDRFYEGRETADLTIGDAAALTVLWNGTDLGNLGAEGQVRRLNLSPTRVGTGPARAPD